MSILDKPTIDLGKDIYEMSQVGGNHYENKIVQPIEYIEANDLGFCEGNIVKYITRYKEKNGIEDLRKAEWYLKRLIRALEEK